MTAALAAASVAVPAVGGAAPDFELVNQYGEPVRLSAFRGQNVVLVFYPFAFSDEDALDPELPYSAYKNDEMRVLIKLNITIGQHTLVDQFEWDINNPCNSPEDFAAAMARDLSLSGEFTTAIAHCIREQSQLFTKSLFSVGHPFDGRPVEDSDLVSAFLQTPLPSVFRPQQQAKEYAPYMYELSEADLERNLRMLVALAEPLLLFIMAAIIGTIVVGMLLPVFMLQDFVK